MVPDFFFGVSSMSVCCFSCVVSGALPDGERCGASAEIFSLEIPRHTTAQLFLATRLLLGPVYLGPGHGGGVSLWDMLPYPYVVG